MAARLDVPVIGADAKPYCEAGRWRASVGWRYQRSARHFVGTEEQVEREEEGSQVINTIHLADLGLRYAISERSSISLGIPYLMAERSSPLRSTLTPEREVFGRTLTQSRAVGDIVLAGRRWMLDPMQHSRWNFSLGLGAKLPTGPDNVVDARQVVRKSSRNTDSLVTEFHVVDQSIQPGDGGFGALFELQSFFRFAGGRAAGYVSASYLANPEGTNGVQTFRSRAAESEMSIADQYVLRLGFGAAVPRVRGLSLGLGGRYEGVPVEDLFGPSTGFRRPGTALSIEPSLSYARGAYTAGFAVPVALRRDRTISVPDQQTPGRHGDAAFADYLIVTSLAREF